MIHNTTCNTAKIYIKRDHLECERHWVQSPPGALYFSVIILGDVQKSKCKSLFSIIILHHCWNMWAVLLVIWLIIETTYFANIWTYIPYWCTSNIRSVTYIFGNGSILLVHTLSVISGVMFRGKAKFCTLVSKYCTYIIKHCSLTYVQNLAAISVFHDKFNSVHDSLLVYLTGLFVCALFLCALSHFGFCNKFGL